MCFSFPLWLLNGRPLLVSSVVSFLKPIIIKGTLWEQTAAFNWVSTWSNILSKARFPLLGPRDRGPLTTICFMLLSVKSLCLLSSNAQKCTVQSVCVAACVWADCCIRRSAAVPELNQGFKCLFLTLTLSVSPLLFLSSSLCCTLLNCCNCMCIVLGWCNYLLKTSVCVCAYADCVFANPAGKCLLVSCTY